MRKILLYGAGIGTRHFLSEYASLRIDFIIDKNEQLWGQKLFAIDIVSPDILDSLVKQESLIIVTSGRYDEIKDKLETKGFQEYFDFLYFDYLEDDVYLTHQGNVKIFKCQKYISRGIKDSFFEILKQNDVRYILLEGQEVLGLINDDQLALLVHNDDINILYEILDSYETEDARLCSVYTTTPRKGTLFENKVPYFPSEIAFDLLERGVMNKHHYIAPDNEDLFLSLSYHVVFHLGERSNLPVNQDGLIFGIYENGIDYFKVLQGLAQESDINVKIDLESLYYFLNARGWIPDPELIPDDNRIVQYLTKGKITIGGLGNRSKVELGKNEMGNYVVIKTFQPEYHSFLEREKEGYNLFSSKCRFIPRILESGKNYFKIPWFNDVIRCPAEIRRLIKENSEVIISIIKVFYHEGYALIDFNPNNLLWRSSGEIVLIDFEFLYKYKEKPSTIFDSYDVVGVPEDFCGDLPKGRKLNFENTWTPIIGKSFSEIYNLHFCQNG